MANKSKIKGSTYESKIRDILTDHFKIKFERVPTSGALKYLKGDVWTMEHYSIWPYTIETKHYAELDFNSLLTARSNDIWNFWQQAQEEAKIMEKKPVVIFRWNRSKDFCIWNDEIETEYQMNVRAFGHNIKIAELSQWLTKIKINIPGK